MTRLARQASTVERRTSDEPPEIVPEIHSLHGLDGERLALQQARVITEVTEWLSHNRTEPGVDRAA
jgi:hypothetical protein